MHGAAHLGVDERALGDDALDADHAADEARDEGARRDVVGAEAAIKADGELVEVLRVVGVHGGDELLERALKAAELLERVLDHAARSLRLLATQVVDVDDEAVTVLGDHVLDLAAVEALVLVVVQKVQVLALNLSQTNLIARIHRLIVDVDLLSLSLYSV